MNKYMKYLGVNASMVWRQLKCGPFIGKPFKDIGQAIFGLARVQRQKS